MVSKPRSGKTRRHSPTKRLPSAVRSCSAELSPGAISPGVLSLGRFSSGGMLAPSVAPPHPAVIHPIANTKSGHRKRIDLIFAKAKCTSDTRYAERAIALFPTHIEPQDGDVT